MEAFPQNERHHYRQKLRTLAYVSLDSTNGGIVRDLGEFGIAVQTLTPLRADQEVHLRLDLQSPRLHLEGEGRVAWADSLGQAGLEFLDLPPRSRRLLKEWVLTQLLANARRVAGDEAGPLLFSRGSRPAIRVDQPQLRPARPVPLHGVPPRQIRLLWFTVSAGRFSHVVDSLALLCAVLLFNVMALMMTDTFPSWPLASALVLGGAVIFTGLYWFLFSVWFGVTPGHRLAELACRDMAGRRNARGESRVRFR